VSGWYKKPSKICSVVTSPCNGSGQGFQGSPAMPRVVLWAPNAAKYIRRYIQICPSVLPVLPCCGGSRLAARYAGEGRSRRVDTWLFVMGTACAVLAVDCSRYCRLHTSFCGGDFWLGYPNNGTQVVLPECSLYTHCFSKIQTTSWFLLSVKTNVFFANPCCLRLVLAAPRLKTLM
jgi:hypothetical protein